MLIAKRKKKKLSTKSLAELSFKNEGETKTFPDEENLKELITTKATRNAKELFKLKWKEISNLKSYENKFSSKGK